MAEKFVFQNVKACVFDAYGTLFDFNSAVGKHQERLDAVGAANAGLHVAWINRFGQRRERLPSQPDVEIKSLADLPALLGF